MALTDKARELREAGEDVIGLAAGEPDFDTPGPIVAAGIEALTSGRTRYTANPGTAELRSAVAKKLREENGLNYGAGDIVVSNGAKQSVAQGIQAVCGPGDEVLVPTPFWVSYPEMVKLAGATPVVLPTTAAEGFMLTPEKLAAALTPSTRMLILCTPSNPSGVVYPRERLEALAEVVRAHPRLAVLSDEIYEHVLYDAEHVSFAGLPGMMARTLTVNGFSKAFAMTGWRLGYMAGPAQWVEAAAAVQGQSTSGASSIAQHAGLAALALGPKGGDTVEGMVAAFRERRDYLVGELQRVGGVDLVVPEGAFYLFPDVSAYFGREAPGFGVITDSDDLCQFLLEAGKLALVPGSAFGNPECVRISYAASMDTLKEAMDRLLGCISELKERE